MECKTIVFVILNLFKHFTTALGVQKHFQNTCKENYSTRIGDDNPGLAGLLVPNRRQERGSKPDCLERH